MDRDNRDTAVFSLSSMIKGFSERSMGFLSRDLTKSSRQARRAKEAAKRRAAPLGIVKARGIVEKAKHTILEGRLERGFQSDFAVNDQDFLVDKKTIVLGELELGNMVTITAAVIENGQWYAEKILVRKISEVLMEKKE